MRIATGGLVPDSTILLDLPVSEGLQRRFNDGELNRLDTAGDAFHERVENGYHALVASEPERWRVVNASAAPAVVAAEVWSAIAPFIERTVITVAYD